MRSEKGFLIDTVDQKSFFDYVKFIEESKKAFDSSKKILRFDEFIRSNGKIKETDEKAQKNYFMLILKYFNYLSKQLHFFIKNKIILN